MKRKNEIRREDLSNEEFEAVVEYFKTLLRWKRELDGAPQAEREKGNSLPTKVTKHGASMRGSEVER